MARTEILETTAKVMRLFQSFPCINDYPLKAFIKEQYQGTQFQGDEEREVQFLLKSKRIFEKGENRYSIYPDIEYSRTSCMAAAVFQKLFNGAEIRISEGMYPYSYIFEISGRLFLLIDLSSEGRKKLEFFSHSKAAESVTDSENPYHPIPLIIVPEEMDFTAFDTVLPQNCILVHVLFEENDIRNMVFYIKIRGRKLIRKGTLPKIIRAGSNPFLPADSKEEKDE